MSLALYLLSIFGNLWVYKIARDNVLVFLGILVASTALVRYVSGSKKISRKYIIVSLAIVIFIQLVNFKLINFTELSNDEVRVRDERLSMYPSENLRLGYYFEQKREVVAIRRVTDNFLSQIDPNLYFFAGHPRERLGVVEFEKFPFIFLPFFLFGAYTAIKNKKYLLFLFLVPVLINSVNRITNETALFPFFAVTLYLGLVQSNKLTRRKYRKYFYVLFGILYVLVLFQTIGYEIY